MQQGKVDCVVVGSDRIAANGDVANKIGTYTVAVLAKEHKIPFFVAAPTSTIDLEASSGAAIPIEERSSDEVVVVNNVRITPDEVLAAYPAFDVTPNRLVEAIITEEGVANEGKRRGVYVGDGLTGTVYSLDDVSDGAPNFCIEHWDLANEKIELEFSRIEK